MNAFVRVGLVVGTLVLILIAWQSSPVFYGTVCGIVAFAVSRAQSMVVHSWAHPTATAGQVTGRAVSDDPTRTSGTRGVPTKLSATQPIPCGSRTSDATDARTCKSKRLAPYAESEGPGDGEGLGMKGSPTPPRFPRCEKEPPGEGVRIPSGPNAGKCSVGLLSLLSRCSVLPHPTRRTPQQGEGGELPRTMRPSLTLSLRGATGPSG